MLETEFSNEELTKICQILKRHGTDCATLFDELRVAHMAASNDSTQTFKHVRLLKEFGILKDRDLLCHTCVKEVIDHHADTCAEYKEAIKSDKFFLPCPDEHYNFSQCEPAVWMVDSSVIYRLEHQAAKKDYEEGRRANIRKIRGEPIFENDIIVGYGKDIPHFTFYGRIAWLEEMFPDMDDEIRHNPWMGFLCEKHIGSMRPFANRIIGYC